MPHKLGKCKLCDNNNEKPTVKGLCQYHYWNERKKTYASKPAPKRKATGELAFFKVLFETRKRNCYLTGEKLKSYDYYKAQRMFHNLFHHVLPKGLYPSFRLTPKNIILLKPDVHHDVETMATSDLLTKYSKYEQLLELKERLKNDYRLQFE